MSTARMPGEAIEGLVIDGQSRDPLVYRGMKPHNGSRYERWVASFDARASINTPLNGAEPRRIEPAASTASGSDLVSAKALIHSVKCRVAEKVAPGSARHQTNVWHFPQQTAVRIDRGHAEIVAAVQARAQAAALGGRPKELESTKGSREP